MTEAAGLTGYSRAIDDILCPNALKVLEKRYLMKDEDGRATEKPSDMFMRVAQNIAGAERAWGADDAGVAEVAEDFYQLMTSLEFLPNADERRARSPAALGLLCTAGRGFDGVDLWRGERHRAYSQIRGRDGLQLLQAASWW
jgi:hypothetical protein